MKPKLIVFDFDGTLADTTATILRTYNMAIKEMGADSRTDAECQATIGIPLRDGFRQLYPDFSEAELDRCVKTYRKIFNENKQQLIPKLYPGVKETLAKLAEQKIQMSVASSRSRDSLVEFCDDNDITEYFDLILGADDVTHAKPDPEPVLVTLNRLGQRPEDTVVVGDMPVDVAMGKGAGCKTIGVTYGNSTRKDLENAGATCVIESFPQLTETILKI